MGGRGNYSYSSNNTSVASSEPLPAYAAASLNRGIAGGTTTDSAINRFRDQMMDKKVEYSAYIDDRGYVHALGSTVKEGSTAVAPISAVAKEKGISTIVHNHPDGTSDGRKWGGPFSSADLSYIASAYSQSNGNINRMVATAKEGTYSAVVKKPVSQLKVGSAAKAADAKVKGMKFQSEKAMWREVNKAYTEEFSKIGIDITYTPQKKTKSKLVTQQIGTY